MSRRLLFAMALCLMSLPSSHAQEPASKQQQPTPLTAPGETPPNPNETAQKELEQALTEYSEIFNKHDAKALAECWSSQCVYIDSENGDQVEGRAAIEADFAGFFKEQPHARLINKAERVRFIRPDVVSVEGIATVFTDDDDPTETKYSAVIVKQDGRWLLDTVHESDVPTPATPYDALKDLEWMVGHWVDDSEGVQVDTVVRWSSHRAFLIRAFKVQRDDEDALEGTQIIGWDPSSKRVRSWSFYSDGSFGLGSWLKDGEEWAEKVNQTLADGRQATATYLIKQIDDITGSVQRVGYEIDGEPQPTAEPVQIRRMNTQDDAQPAPESGKEESKEEGQ